MRYIGSSARVVARLGEHRRALSRGCHPNSRMQKEWDIDGGIGFVFKIIERSDDAAHRLVREQYWMDHFRVLAGRGPALFNVIPVADRSKPHTFTISEEARERGRLRKVDRELFEDWAFVAARDLWEAKGKNIFREDLPWTLRDDFTNDMNVELLKIKALQYRKDVLKSE